MNKEQPQTEAEAMKIAAEAWDTPVEKNEAAEESIGTNTEAKEDAVDMEIQNESTELEKNSEAVKKALADVGGMEGLQLTLQEMPEDKKTAMITKLEEEYNANMAKRKETHENTKEWLQLSSLGVRPLTVIEILTDNSSGRDGDLHPVLATLGTTALFATGVPELLGALGMPYFGAKSIKEKIGMNMAERRHKKELKKLENSEG